MEIIVISSGKGGVGKSVFSAYLGNELAMMNRKVLIIEMGFGLRSLDLIMGVENKTVYDLSDVIAGRCEPIKAIVESDCSSRLFLLPAPVSEEFKASELDLISLFKGLSNYFDYVILDTPSDLGCRFHSCVKVATKAVIIATPDPISVRDSKKTCDIMFKFNIPDIRLVINKVNDKNRKLNVISDLDLIIDDVGAKLIGVIPTLDEIKTSSSNGICLDKDGVASKIFSNIAHRLEGEIVPLFIL